MGLVRGLDHIATGRCPQRVQLGIDVELGLRLDKGPSVVAHWLVSSIWILDKDCITGGENDHEEEYGGED